MTLSANQFIELLKSCLADLDDRYVSFGNKSLGTYDIVSVTLINLPLNARPEGGGAEAMNNRVLLFVNGFDRSNPDASTPSGKVEVKIGTSALPRDTRLRAKTAAPEVVAKYVADYFKKIAREVPPRFTDER